jgi:hypothetical protein
MSLTITTNNQYRPLLTGCSLTTEERKEFDYYTEEEIDCATFFKFKGQVYDLGEFMRIDRHDIDFSAYDGYRSDSFFSGLLIKLSNCGDMVKVATYYS